MALKYPIAGRAIISEIIVTITMKVKAYNKNKCLVDFTNELIVYRLTSFRQWVFDASPFLKLLQNQSAHIQSVVQFIDVGRTRPHSKLK